MTMGEGRKDDIFFGYFKIPATRLDSLPSLLWRDPEKQRNKEEKKKKEKEREAQRECEIRAVTYFKYYT